MPDRLLTDLKTRQRINETIETFFYDVSPWTPAMGAMLVCGIVPSVGATEIPAQAMALSHLGKPATQSDLRSASYVLEEWIDSHCSDGQDEASGASEVKPADFMMWCIETYEGMPYTPPPWLGYWLTHFGWGPVSEIPTAVPGVLISRVAELESFASVVVSKSESVHKAVPTDRLTPEDRDYVNRMCELIRTQSKTSIAESIVAALSACNNPQNPTAVWVELCELAKTGKHAALRYDNSKLQVPRGDSAWANYTLRALTQFLSRYRAKALKV